MKYLTGLKGTLVQKKKKEAERKAAATNGSANPPTGPFSGQGQQVQQMHSGQRPFHMI